MMTATKTTTKTTTKISTNNGQAWLAVAFQTRGAKITNERGKSWTESKAQASERIRALTGFGWVREA